MDGNGELFAIDPGTFESAYVWMVGSKVDQAGKIKNHELRDIVSTVASRCPKMQFAIEMVACYGRPVGEEVFETCLWIGRFIEAIGDESRVAKITRAKVKMNLCHATAKVTDSHIRQALIDRYGPGKDVAIGNKKSPGPLYELKKDMWSALAVGVTYSDMLDRERERLSV